MRLLLGEGIRESSSDTVRPGINSLSYSEPTYKAKKIDEKKLFCGLPHLSFLIKIILESGTLTKKKCFQRFVGFLENSSFPIEH